MFESKEKNLHNNFEKELQNIQFPKLHVRLAWIQLMYA
jgi:hypothetical protein